MKGILDFYGTLIEFTIPETYSEFKKSLSNELVMDASDVEELTIKYKKNEEYKSINPENYSEFLANATDKIVLNIEINEKSKIFEREKEKIINESKIQQEKEDYPESGIDKELMSNENKFFEADNENNLERVSQYCSSVIHHGVQCLGCHVEPIVGIRYKCTICNNFNLCEKCEREKSESHKHPFIKIRLPETK